MSRLLTDEEIEHQLGDLPGWRRVWQTAARLCASIAHAKVAPKATS